MNLAETLRLMAVTDGRSQADRGLVADCLAAARGGATCVQLRLKQTSPRDLAALARRLIELLPVPLIVNDRADVALAVGAAGVHLGPDDVPAALVRRLAPAGFLVGVSVGLQREIGNGQAADYWGVGPWHATATKSDAGPPLGPDGFQAIVRQAAGRPCIAIGGIRPEDVLVVREAGGAGVAVVSGIFSGDPEAGARGYCRWVVRGKR